MLIDSGKRVKIVDISDYYWNDVGHPWQLLDTNRYVLSKLLPEEPVINLGATIEDYVQIYGPVVIGKDAIIKSGTYIEGPAYIGEKSIIGPHAYIRPFASIGNECHIGNSSEVKASVIMDHVLQRISHILAIVLLEKASILVAAQLRLMCDWTNNQFR